MICNGCAHPADDRNPQPEMCEHCPPRECGDCGEKYTVIDLCSCWMSLDSMPLADLKAMFATAGLGVEKR